MHDSQGRRASGAFLAVATRAGTAATEGDGWNRSHSRSSAALPPEPEWLLQGLLAPGSLTLLAGHPFAGKSMLISGLLQALEVASRSWAHDHRRPVRCSSPRKTKPRCVNVRQGSACSTSGANISTEVPRSVIEWSTLIDVRPSLRSPTSMGSSYRHVSGSCGAWRRARKRRWRDHESTTATAEGGRRRARGRIPAPYEQRQPATRIEGVPRGGRHLDPVPT